MNNQKKYNVSVMFPYIPENVKGQVLQEERKKVNELKEKGVVQNLFVGESMKEAWMIIVAENKQSVLEIMETLPIFPYLHIEKIVPLNPNI